MLSSLNLELDCMIVIVFIVLTNIYYLHSFLLAGIFAVINVASDNIKTQ